MPLYHAALTGGRASCCRLFFLLPLRPLFSCCFRICIVAENAANVMLATWKLQKHAVSGFAGQLFVGGATSVSRSCRGRNHLSHVEFGSAQKCFAPHEYQFFASISGIRFHFKAMRHFSTYFPCVLFQAPHPTAYATIPVRRLLGDERAEVNR